MKTFIEAEIKQILDQYAQGEITFSRMVEIINEKAELKQKEYARQCCEDVLNRAAENAEVDYTNNDRAGYSRSYHVDKESITSTEIILP